MSMPEGWDAGAAVAACPRIAWAGRVFRGHARRYRGDDPGGSLRVSGRYHRGLDQFRPEAVWPALYTSLERDTYVWEMLRHVPWHDPAVAWQMVSNRRRSMLVVQLSWVLDCRDPSPMGLTVEEICHPADYRLTQDIGAAAQALGAEGLLVPSITRTGHNLVIFTANLRDGSSVAVAETVDPHL